MELLPSSYISCNDMCVAVIRDHFSWGWRIPWNVIQSLPWRDRGQKKLQENSAFEWVGLFSPSSCASHLARSRHLFAPPCARVGTRMCVDLCCLTDLLLYFLGELLFFSQTEDAQYFIFKKYRFSSPFNSVPGGVDWRRPFLSVTHLVAVNVWHSECLDVYIINCKTYTHTCS